MPFLPHNQQHQSTEGISTEGILVLGTCSFFITPKIPGCWAVVSCWTRRCRRWCVGSVRSRLRGMVVLASRTVRRTTGSARCRAVCVTACRRATESPSRSWSTRLHRPASPGIYRPVPVTGVSSRDCCSRWRFQPYDCVVIRFVE